MHRLITALTFCLVSFLAYASPKYSTGETEIGTLLNDPKALAILQEYIPKTLSNPQFSMAGTLTLKFVSAYDDTGELTNENLDKIDAEFQKIVSK